MFKGKLIPVASMSTLLVVCSTAFGFGSESKPTKEDFKHSKCIGVATPQREHLAYSEICKYGAACPKENSGKKIMMYCLHENLSECFENKAWKTANQLLGLDDAVEIGRLSLGLSIKNGAQIHETCGYFN